MIPQRIIFSGNFKDTAIFSRRAENDIRAKWIDWSSSINLFVSRNPEVCLIPRWITFWTAQFRDARVNTMAVVFDVMSTRCKKRILVFFISHGSFSRSPRMRYNIPSILFTVPVTVFFALLPILLSLPTLFENCILTKTQCASLACYG